MEDAEIAALLLAQCRRRMTCVEIHVCETIVSGEAFMESGKWIHDDDRAAFEMAKTQFARELANAGKVVAR